MQSTTGFGRSSAEAISRTLTSSEKYRVHGLIRRGYKVTAEKNGEKEIDFIARKGASAIYVQVTYLLESKNTIER